MSLFGRPLIDTPPMFAFSASAIEALIDKHIASMQTALAHHEDNLTKLLKGDGVTMHAPCIVGDVRAVILQLRARIEEEQFQRKAVSHQGIEPIRMTLDQALRLQEHYRSVTAKTLEEMEREHQQDADARHAILGTRPSGVPAAS